MHQNNVMVTFTWTQHANMGRIQPSLPAHPSINMGSGRGVLFCFLRLLISTEPVVSLWYSLCFVILYQTRGEIYWYPRESTFDHYTYYLCYMFCSHFSFPCSGSPWTSRVVSVQMMMDTFTLRGPKEYHSIIGVANPSIKLSSPFSLFTNPPEGLFFCKIIPSSDHSRASPKILNPHLFFNPS